MSANKKNGCTKQIGIGCLVLLIILLVGGTIIGLKFRSSVKEAGGFKAWQNQKTAEFMDYIVQQSLSKMPLNDNEKASINKVVKRVSEKLLKGEIDERKSSDLVIAGYRSVLPEVFISLYFQKQQIKKDDLEGIVAANRFANGLLQGKISPEAAMPVMNIILSNPEQVSQLHLAHSGDKKDPSRDIRFRKELSPAEVQRAISEMNSAADKAGVHNARTDLNFTPLLENILQQVAPDKETATQPVETDNAIK